MEYWSTGVMDHRSRTLCTRESRRRLFKVSEDRYWVFVFSILHYSLRAGGQHSNSMSSRATSWSGILYEHLSGIKHL